ncbi:PREDICTED: NADH dehydrogenase [ubiquinone] 1 subunit C1, mitochondrial isoform X2 [Sturnus vulgaris]|uniref:NADH dehydrogenase [ubiquinone] 1 subunit C1, mitochondrial isoform X1 n=1 Tax=Sturnus vulgaris TaxID=9172 RepID=UPI00071A0A6E|nr:PREDICTED: NADH dehydrogenase [ubiquinone] 1 subunit C1, mitochondrial isoform X1 [Sturnus vulgaris]XP_014749123.1 PREDICTED: NADH dehydrogenase [ubiquinone] 1 subunit C1, mitochondrial isoform X2 [Sturnus vulgaris]
MAAGLRAVRRWGLVAAAPRLAFTRSASVVKKVNNGQPSWLGVGMAFGTSAAVWAFLIKEHNEDVMEYEKRQQKRRHKCTGCS